LGTKQLGGRDKITLSINSEKSHKKGKRISWGTGHKIMEEGELVRKLV
jgi:hypothetical protein